jgi:hypothetical protein
MLKKDPIFWCATGIFLLGVALFAITKNQYWVALGIGSYLLRPTMASLGVAGRHIDERQMSINYRSGNIGFAVLLVTCVLCMAKLEREGNHDFELFATAIVLGLAAKALFNVILVKNYREAASKIIISAGLLIALFASMDGGSLIGILMQAAPGLAIAGIGLLAKKYPRPVGLVVTLATACLILLIMTVGLANSKSFWGQIAVAVIVGAPLLTAGVLLFLPSRGEAEAEVR